MGVNIFFVVFIVRDFFKVGHIWFLGMYHWSTENKQWKKVNKLSQRFFFKVWIVSENEMGSPLRVFQNSIGNNSPEAVGHVWILGMYRWIAKNGGHLFEFSYDYEKKQLKKRIAWKYERKRKLNSLLSRNLKTVVCAKGIVGASLFISWCYNRAPTYPLRRVW